MRLTKVFVKVKCIDNKIKSIANEKQVQAVKYTKYHKISANKWSIFDEKAWAIRREKRRTKVMQINTNAKKNMLNSLLR